MSLYPQDPLLQTREIIRNQLQFPQPILASDGVMRIPLKKDTLYIIDVVTLTLTTPFLVPTELVDSGTGFTLDTGKGRILYTGTDSLFFGTDSTGFTLNGLIVSSNNAVLFDVKQAVGINQVIQASSFSLVDFNGGIIDGYNAVAFRIGSFKGLTGSISLNNISNFLLAGIEWSNASGATISCIVLTGTFESIAMVAATLPFLSGGSLIAIDSAIILAAPIQLNGQLFRGDSGTFLFEPQLTGSITAFADSAADPGVDTTVTSTAHGMTKFRTHVIAGTTNYNATHKVTRIIDANNFDIDTAFVADDATGTFTATSLDKTSISTNATDNGVSADSATIGTFLMTGNTNTTSPGAVGNFVDIDLGNLVVPVPLNERFNLTNNDNLEMTYIGLVPANCLLSFTYVATATVNNKNAGIKFVIDKGAGFVDLPIVTIQSTEFTNKPKAGDYDNLILLKTGDKLKPQISNQETGGVNFDVSEVVCLIHEVG